MTNGNEFFFFTNCNTNEEKIEQCKGEEKIVSIYHVCGIDPWLIICKTNISDAIKLNNLYKLNIKYMSIAPTTYRRWGRGVKVSNQENYTLSWIFIKGSQTDSFIGKIERNNVTPDYEVTEIYKIFGEFHFIVKLYTSNINGVDKFLTYSRENRMSTTTKCVLSTIKEGGQIIENNVKTKREKAMNVKKERSYAVARIMANTKGFIQKDKGEQQKTLKKELGNLIGSFILDPSTRETEYDQYDLQHPNNLIDRYSIKLNRNKWLKTLFFFKAVHGQKDKLEKVLQEDLLCVQRTRFSRKLYHITGDYDFMVPFDCADMDILNKTIDEFVNKIEKLITSFTNTICRPTGEGREADYLNELDVYFIESLLINATQINQFEQRVKGKDIFLSILNRTGSILAEEGITPREDYIRNKIKNEPENVAELKDYLQRFSSFESIGIESTIEFKDGALIQVLSKFYLSESNLKKLFLDKIDEKIKNCEIIAIPYEPVRDPLTVMCILVVKDLVELEVIFNDFKEYYKKVEFHVLFHQRYYSKVIEQNIRCKPCFYPLVPKEDCEKECDRCNDQKECIKQNCGNCIRYILPRQRNRILNIPFLKEIKKDTKIYLVGIDTSLSQFFALERSLDQESKRERIFNNYRKFINDTSGDSGPYESYDEVLKKYDGVLDKESYRNQYKDAIIEVLQHVFKKSPDIIIFPEYTIPSYVYNEIKNTQIQSECIIVAGSHIDNDRFNVCPIIFNKADGGKNIYHYYKNNFSSFERALGLVENKGTAYLKFLKVPVGNLYILVCFDAYTISTVEKFKEVDVLLVPSFNPSSKFISPLNNKANEYKLVVAYANTINNCNKIKSNFFVPTNEGLNPRLGGVEPFHKNQWPSEAMNTRDKLFYISPPDDQLEELKKGGFDFKLKHIVFDLIQLDKRRQI